jgi:hypothetical protein
MSEENEQERLKEKIRKLDEQIAFLNEIKQKCINHLRSIEVLHLRHQKRKNSPILLLKKI